MREMQFSHIDVTAADSVLVVPTSGSRIIVWAIKLWNIALQDVVIAADYSPLDTYPGLPAASGMMYLPSLRPHFSLPPGAQLRLLCSGGSRVTGYVSYTLENSPQEIAMDSAVSVQDLMDAVKGLGGLMPSAGIPDISVTIPGLSREQENAVVQLIRAALAGRL